MANTIACTVSYGCSVDVHSGRSFTENVASEIFVGKTNKDRRKTSEVIVFASKHHSTDRFSDAFGYRTAIPDSLEVRLLVANVLQKPVSSDIYECAQL